MQSLQNRVENGVNKAKTKEKNAEKRHLKRVDKELTEIFSHLNSNDQILIDAIANNNGQITQRLGGFNSLSQYFKRLGGLLNKDFVYVSASMVKDNEAFQNYQKRLRKEGFEIKVDPLNSLASSFIIFPKVSSGSLLGVSLLTATSPLTLPTSICFGLLGTAVAYSTNLLTSELNLQVTPLKKI